MQDSGAELYLRQPHWPTHEMFRYTPSAPRGAPDRKPGQAEPEVDLHSAVNAGVARGEKSRGAPLIVAAADARASSARTRAMGARGFQFM
jgi:hypothetical protein